MHSKSSPAPANPIADAAVGVGSSPPRRQQPESPRSQPENGASDVMSTLSPHSPDRASSDSSPAIFLPSNVRNPTLVTVKSTGTAADEDDELSDPPEFGASADDTEDDDPISVDDAGPAKPAAQRRPVKAPGVVRPVSDDPEDDAEDEDAYEDVEAVMDQDDGSDGEDEQIQIVRETPAPAAPVPQGPVLPQFLAFPNENDVQFKNRMLLVRRKFTSRSSTDEEKFHYAHFVQLTLAYLLSNNSAFSHSRSQFFVLRIVPDIAERLLRERVCHPLPFINCIDQIVNNTLYLFTQIPDQLVHDSGSLIRAVHQLLEEDPLGMDDSEDDEMNEFDDYSFRLELIQNFTSHYNGLPHTYRYAKNPGLPFHLLRLLIEIASSCQSIITPSRPPYASEAIRNEALREEHMYNTITQLMLDLSQAAMARVKLLGRSDEDIKAVERRQFSELIEVVDVMNQFAAKQLKQTIASVCLACTVLDKRLYGLAVVKDLINSVSAPPHDIVRQLTAACAVPQVAPAAGGTDINTAVTPAVPNASPMIGPQLPGQVSHSAAAAIAAQASQSAQNALASFMANYRPEFGSPKDRESADLAHWLISENIMDRLFVRNVHLELVQRAGDVMCFLLRRSVITDADMSPVWHLLGPMHHATVRAAAARVLGECASEMSIETLQASIVRVREMDAGGVDEHVVSMVQQMVRAILERRRASIAEGQMQYHQYLQRVEQYLQCLAVVSRLAPTSPTGSQQQQQQVPQQQLHQLPRQLSLDEHLTLVQQTVGESLDLVWNLARDSSHLPTYKRSDLAWWMDGTIRYSPTLSGDDWTPLMVSALGDLHMHQSVVPACIVLRALVVNGTLDDAETRAMIRAKVVDDFVAISKNPQWDPKFAIDEEFRARANLLHVLVSLPAGSDVAESGAGTSGPSAPLTRDEGIKLWDALAPSPLLQQTFFGYLKWIIEETETGTAPETRAQNRSVVARLVIDGVRERLAAVTPSGTAADGSELVSESLMHLVREAVVYVAVEDGEMTPDKTVIKPVANEDLVWQILVGGAAAAGLSVPGSPISPIMRSSLAARSNSTSNVDQTVVQSAAQFIVSLSLQGSHEYLASSVEPFVTRVITRLGQTADVRAFRSILHVLQMYMAQFQARFPKPAGAVGGQDVGVSLPHKSMLGAVKPLVLIIRANGSDPKAASASLELELPGLSTVGMLRSRLAELLKVTDNPDRVRPFARGKELKASGSASQLLSELGIENRDTIQVMIRPLKAEAADKTPSPPAETSTDKSITAESPDSEKLKALQVSSNAGDDAARMDEGAATTQAATTADATQPEPPALPVESPDPEMLEALQVIYSIDADAMDEGTPAASPSPPSLPSIPSPQVLLTRPELFSHIMHLLSFGDRRALLVYGFLQELPTLPSLAHELTPEGSMPATDLLNPRLPYRYLYTLEVLQIAALQQGYDSNWRTSMRARGVLRTVANNLVDLDLSQKAGRRCLLASMVVLSTVAQELADDPQVQVQQIEEFMCRTVTSGSHAEIVCECLRFLFLLVSLRPQASAGPDVCGVVQGVLMSAEPQVRSFACEQLMVATSLPMDLVSHLWSLVDVDGMPSELYAILGHFLETPLAVSVRASPETVNRLFESVRNNPTAPKLGLLASLIAPGCAPSEDDMFDFGQALYMNMYPAEWNEDPPICNPDMREAAHRVIASMCRVSTKLPKVISEKLVSFLIPDAIMSKPFDYDPKKATRRTFVGLVNQGATCYQNSLLQHFFMDRAFRRGILECDPLPDVLAEANGGGGADAKPASGGKEKKRKERGPTIRALQVLFAKLQESQYQYVDTSTFIDTLRTADGEEINPFVQMDVDEFYNQLLDRLESEMKGTPQVDMLDHRYGGHLVHMIESNECGHVSTREEPYHALQCEVKGRQTLEESLAHYVQGESLSGDNKYRCSTCNNLVDAVKSTRVGTLPTNLIFHLKRFEFDMEFFHRIKINDRFEFPPTIDMRPYLTPAGRTAAPGSAADPGETKFDLTGVLVHMGTSESGHYYSFIRDAETLEWFQFNDTVVSPFQVDHLPEEAFGGGKANSAYMLVYRRRGTADDPAAEQAAAKAAIPKDVLEVIYAKNAKLRSDLCMFDPPLSQLVLNLGQVDPPHWICPVAVYYVRVALRGTDRALLTQISSFITESFSQLAADWFLRYFLEIGKPWAAIAHNVIDAPSADIRANVVNTLSVLIRERASDPVACHFALVMSNVFVEVDLRTWWRTCDQICVLALAVCDRIPNAFNKNIVKLIHTVTGDWDKKNNQGTTSIVAISKPNLRPANLLILRAIIGSELREAPNPLFVPNDHHVCPYFFQLAFYCHEWPELAQFLGAIASKFRVAGKMFTGLIGAMKVVPMPESHLFLRQAFQLMVAVSTQEDRELALGWLKWVVDADWKELSEVTGVSVVLSLFMLAGCEDTLPCVRQYAATWMKLRASSNAQVKGGATQFMQAFGMLLPANPPAPAGS